MSCVHSMQESETDEEVELTFEQRRQKNMAELEAVKRKMGLVRLKSIYVAFYLVMHWLRYWECVR